MICVPHKIFCNQIQNEIGGDCGTHGIEYKGLQGFGEETWREEIAWQAMAWVGDRIWRLSLNRAKGFMNLMNSFG